MPLTVEKFSSREQLVTKFSDQICQCLNAAIKTKGKASLAVSGGSTPLPLFQQLSQSNDIDWSKINVVLVDERWVDNTNPDSNETLVKNNLLSGFAQNANYVSIKDVDQTPEATVAEMSERLASLLPIDVVILGMGLDGHTASLFPCSEQLEQGLDLSCDASLIAVEPTTAPHKRISFTLKSIVTSSSLFLHLTGENKLEVLMDAIQADTANKKPIAVVADKAELQLKWAP